MGHDVPEPSVAAAGRHDIPANAAVAAGHGVACASSILEVGWRSAVVSFPILTRRAACGWKLTGRAQVRSAVAADDEVLFLSGRTVTSEDKFPVVVLAGGADAGGVWVSSLLSQAFETEC